MRDHILIKTVLFSALTLIACDHDENHEGHNHDQGNTQAAQTLEAEAAENSNEIVLEPAVAEQFGVVVSEIQPAQFAEVISATGQIIDSPNSSSLVVAPVSGIVTFSQGIHPSTKVSNGQTVARISTNSVAGGDPNAQAKAALNMAEAELNRLKPLYAEGIVTGRAYNEAVQNYEQAKAAYSSAAASGLCKATAAGVIDQLLVQQGQYVEAGSPIATVTSNSDLTIRIDLPASQYANLPNLNSAMIQLPYSEKWIDISELNGQLVSQSTSGAQKGYVPVYFTIKNNGMILPGTYLKANLLGLTRDNVISVPTNAISEQQGAYFVYEQVDEECYKKIPVKIGQSNGKTTEIVSGLNGGENIVVDGMIGVRLAETSAVAPEGHSHNH